jgi:uncharacterized damage-inducible protein DinB
MRSTRRLLTTVLAALLLAAPASAQTRDGVMGELLKGLDDVEKKMTDLAKAMPESAWTWRPGPGVRSTSEVLLHVAADNYFLPVLLDVPAPAATGITKEYKTVAAFEKQTLGRDALLVELQKSFAFVKQSMRATPDTTLDTPVEFFGQKSTTRGVWIVTLTHLHEHLGQLIAYARSNGVVPPWSK